MTREALVFHQTQFIKVGSWHVAGTSSVGAHHWSRDRQNEDAFAFMELPHGGFAALVADGVGSALRGGDGARQAVKFVGRQLADGSRQTNLDMLVRDAFLHGQSYLQTIAKREGLAAEAFDTTLLAFVIRDDRAIFARVGDGGCLAVRRAADGSATPYPVADWSDASRGFTASLATSNLAKDLITEQIAHLDVGRIAALAIATDGVRDVPLRHRFWDDLAADGAKRGLYAALPDALNLLHALAAGGLLGKNQFADDTTLAIAYRDLPVLP